MYKYSTPISKVYKPSLTYMYSEFYNRVEECSSMEECLLNMHEELRFYAPVLKKVL
jgi:hypothetical protein